MLITDKFIGFGICCLLIEINSVFLHTRTLMRDHQINCFPLQVCMAWFDLSTSVIYRHYNCIWGLVILWSQLFKEFDFFLVFCFTSLVIIEGRFSWAAFQTLTVTFYEISQKLWTLTWRRNGLPTSSQMDASELTSTQYLLSVLHNIEYIFDSLIVHQYLFTTKNSVEAGQDIQIGSNISQFRAKISDQ